jgi:EAL domain-containing protein (putative c-di-GMP-specific phosphodiesterase class I)
LRPDRLELELTENILLDASPEVLAQIEAIRGYGVRFALDDFGKGYCSLAYLQTFSFDRIKIDRSFIANLSSRPACLAIIRAVTQLAMSLGMQTTAEGVETEGQAAILAATGVTGICGSGIIEAIAEIPQVKHDLFRALAAATKPDAILATNTSAISVTGIAEASGRAERVVGLHFFNPAPVMPLVEVVHTQHVDPAVYAAAIEFAEGLGKEAVPCPDTPGFIVNRILVPMLNDAVRTYAETGADGVRRIRQRNVYFEDFR